MKKVIIVVGVVVVLFLFRYNIATFFASQNSETLLEYYQYLLKKNPEKAYGLCINNLKNKDSKVIATSYDNLNEMTVPEAMIFYANQKDAFSKEQMQNIYDWIFKNLDKNQNLVNVLSVYLYENEKKPNPKYYSYVKKEIERMVRIPNENNSIYFNYFYNYKKEEDSVLLKRYIEKAIFEEKNAYNFTLEVIVNHPKKEYFSILKKYYEKKIEGKTFRSDISYFEPEEFVIAIIKYQNKESENMLNEIVFDTNYETYDGHNSSNEHIYLLLNDLDTMDYFSEIKEKLKNKIDNEKLQKIIDYKKRWNHK